VSAGKLNNCERDSILQKWKFNRQRQAATPSNTRWALVGSPTLRERGEM
jgi:hypothetical protein